MNILDILILIPLLWSAYRGFSKGFIISVATLLALLLGIYGAIRFSDITANYLVEQFDLTSNYLHEISLAITFMIIVIAVHFFARILDKLVKAVALGFINRLSGALFGILKTTLIICIVIFLLNRFDTNSKLISQEQKESSWLYKPFSNITDRILTFLDFDNLDELRDKFEEEKSKYI